MAYQAYHRYMHAPNIPLRRIERSHTVGDTTLSVPTPSVGGAVHFLVGLAVFMIFFILASALLVGLRARGIDPVGSIASVFVPAEQGGTS